MAGPVSLLKEQWDALRSEQRIAVGVFGVVAVILLAFGLIQIRAALINPFTTDVQTLVDLREELGPTQEELLREQQRTDTDGDGISDYDESTVYFTSPYVRDSDSDGEDDNVEIAKGTDPNCPKGKTCTAIATGTEVATGTSGFVVPPGAGTAPTAPGAGLPGNTGTLPSRDPAAIRAYLEASGVSAAELSNYTDTQLLQAYDQSAAQLAQEEEEAPAQEPTDAPSGSTP